MLSLRETDLSQERSEPSSRPNPDPMEGVDSAGHFFLLNFSMSVLPEIQDVVKMGGGVGGGGDPLGGRLPFGKLSILFFTLKTQYEPHPPSLNFSPCVPWRFENVCGEFIVPEIRGQDLWMPPGFAS